MNSTTQLANAVMSSANTALDPERAWEQVVRRDSGATFFYAVITTGVVCRPACKSRLPLRANVRFFGSVAEAQTAGFRPCLRCNPAAPPAGDVVQKVRAWIERHADEPVRLAELG